jgi:hypothetical protein
MFHSVTETVFLMSILLISREYRHTMVKKQGGEIGNKNKESEQNRRSENIPEKGCCCLYGAFPQNQKPSRKNQARLGPGHSRRKETGLQIHPARASRPYQEKIWIEESAQR